MTWQGWLQILAFTALITALVSPLGGHVARILEGKSRIQRLFEPIEISLYRIAGIDPAEEQSWVAYALALLIFNVAGVLVLYAIRRSIH